MQTASTSSTFEKHGGPWNKTLQVLVNSGLARRSKHGVGLAARCLTIAWVIWSPEGSQRPTLQRYHAVYWCFLSKDVLYRCIAQRNEYTLWINEWTCPAIPEASTNACWFIIVAPGMSTCPLIKSLQEELELSAVKLCQINNQNRGRWSFLIASSI